MVKMMMMNVFFGDYDDDGNGNDDNGNDDDGNDDDGDYDDCTDDDDDDGNDDDDCLDVIEGEIDNDVKNHNMIGIAI